MCVIVIIDFIRKTMTHKEDITISVTNSEHLKIVYITYRHNSYQLTMSDDYFALHSCIRNGEVIEDGRKALGFDTSHRWFYIFEGSTEIMIMCFKPQYFKAEGQTLFTLITEREGPPKSIYRREDTFFSDNLNIIQHS